MQALYADLSFEQRLAKVDLTRIMARVESETGMSGETLARAEQLYRQYLTLRHRFPMDSMVPPVIVDYVWHAHMEFTRQYMADCESLFGGYLHHEPSDVDTTAEYESVTVPAYASEFGEDFLMARKLNPAHFGAAHCG